MILVIWCFTCLFMLVVGLAVMAQNRERFGINEMGYWGWGYSGFLMAFFLVGAAFISHSGV